MTARLAGEDGFTLVELLCAMTIMLILIFGALMAFDSFNRGAASANRMTDAQDRARRDVNRIVGVLRNAGAPTPVTGAQPATVLRATGTDIVFRSTSWPGESATDPVGTHVARLCVDTSTRTLWFDGMRAGVGGSSDPGTACPSTEPGWAHQPMATGVTNDAANPVFRYGSTSPVRSVGVSLRLESGTVADSRTLQVHSGSALRGALAPQVSASDIVVGECEAGRALLTLGATGGEGTGGARLHATGAITVGPGQILVDATTSPVDVALTVTNVLGLQTLLFKRVSCP